MKVMILNDTGFSARGGTETYCNILNVINAKLGNKTVKVYLGEEYNDDPEAIALDGVNVPVMRVFYDKILEKGLIKLCSDFEVDLIHANILNARYPLILSNMSSKLKLPLVLTVHRWAYICPSGYNVVFPELLPCDKPSLNLCVKCVTSKAKFMHIPVMSSVGRALHRVYAFKSLMRKANFVISPSRIFTTELYDRFKISSYYIPNPIDRHLIEEKPEPKGDGSVIFIGRLEYEKGAHLLSQLAKILNNVKIHVVGVGSLKKSLLKSKPPNIFYHGFISGHKKYDFIQRSSVVIVPSIVQEMYPYTVSEALALGKPVVAFDLGGPKEQIEGSGGGLLAEPFEIKDFAEKVMYLLENPSEAKRRGLMGRKWVQENLHPDRYAKKLANVYEYAVIYSHCR